MEKLTEFRTRKGGMVRIMLDYAPKTPQQKQQRQQEMTNTMMEVLANAVSINGMEVTRERMMNGPHADLVRGRG